MSPTTPEEREDLILQILTENPDGIGFNQLQKETGITRKTLNRYLKQMKKDEKVIVEKHGKKPNSPLVITANFSPKTKALLQRNFETKTKYHWTRYPTKIQKVNVFSHYLQTLASEYYQSMIFYLFGDAPSYKFILNRLEEQLKKERKLLSKEFGEKNLRRIWDSCNEIEFGLWTHSTSAISHAATRKNFRTRDEISVDNVSFGQMDEGPMFEVDPEESFVEDSGPFILDDSRWDLINDKKTKEEFRKLAVEYNETTQKLTDLQMQMTWISGMYLLDDPHLKQS